MSLKSFYEKFIFLCVNEPIKCLSKHTTTGRSMLPFFENKKSALILEKKCPDCVHPLAKICHSKCSFKSM